MRVHELAKKLGMTNAEMMALCEAMGVGVKTHSSTLIEAQADRLERRAIRDGLTRDEQPEEPSRSRRRRRRRPPRPRRRRAELSWRDPHPPKKAAAKKAAADTCRGRTEAGPVGANTARATTARAASRVGRIHVGQAEPIQSEPTQTQPAQPSRHDPSRSSLSNRSRRLPQPPHLPRPRGQRARCRAGRSRRRRAAADHQQSPRSRASIVPLHRPLLLRSPRPLPSPRSPHSLPLRLGHCRPTAARPPARSVHGSGCRSGRRRTPGRRRPRHDRRRRPADRFRLRPVVAVRCRRRVVPIPPPPGGLRPTVPTGARSRWAQRSSPRRRIQRPSGRSRRSANGHRWPPAGRPRWRPSGWIWRSAPRWRLRWPASRPRWPGWRSWRWARWPASRWRWPTPERPASRSAQEESCSSSSRLRRHAAVVQLQLHGHQRAGARGHDHRRAWRVGAGVRSEAEPHRGRRHPLPPAERRDGHGHDDPDRRADGAVCPRGRRRGPAGRARSARRARTASDVRRQRRRRREPARARVLR